MVYKLFALLCFVFHGAAPPYVQVVILNLPHLYLRSTTILLDCVEIIGSDSYAHR